MFKMNYNKLIIVIIANCFLGSALGLHLESIIGFNDYAPTFMHNATESDITYYFYSRSDSEAGLKIHLSDFNENEDKIKTYFNPEYPTWVLIHGFMGAYWALSNTYIRTALLENYDANVIVVDRNPLASKIDGSAIAAVPAIGKINADFITNLTALFDYSLDKITITGFSLGGHIAGSTGQALGGEVGQIVGLDPAGKQFLGKDADNRLDSSDGKYVTIIHTNAGTNGLDKSIGHSDFWPNGGKSQSSCFGNVLEIAGVCSHTKAYEYYAASLRDNTYDAAKCDSYQDYTDKHCENNQDALMGGFTLDKTARGDFYLTTS